MMNLPSRFSMQIKYVSIIGAGTMGRSIAQWFCQQGSTVYLIDLNEENLYIIQIN